ncbi:hypothetical protein FOCC_FOCC015293 [Frankliniella occidentalis]|nr:hypothetical protein FOCC_FOCC015293 [Frankliniella occidentalis]
MLVFFTDHIFSCFAGNTTTIGGEGGSAVSLLCVSCKASFTSAWDLMVHVQAAHMLNIYELGSAEQQQQQQQQALPQPSASPEQQMKAMPHHVAFSHAQVSTLLEMSIQML